jgi:hypothetical protein
MDMLLNIQFKWDEIEYTCSRWMEEKASDWWIRRHGGAATTSIEKTDMMEASGFVE